MKQKRIMRKAIAVWILSAVLASCSHQWNKYKKTHTTETTPDYEWPALKTETWTPDKDITTAETTTAETTTATETTSPPETIPYTTYETEYERLCDEYKDEIESDIWYLTCFLYGECRGSNQTLQSCCAWVVLNAKAGTKPGNLKNAVKYYSDGSYWSNYITSFGNYNWSHEWTATTGKKAGKVFHLNSKLKTVEEKDPSGWKREMRYATDVYHRWLKERAGYPADEVARTIPKNYLHFWNDKKAKTGTVFPISWATRYDHTKDFKIDYENSPYNK